MADSSDDNCLLDVQAGTIAALVRERNAWHRTWVRHRFENTHLFSDVASAKLGAEELRQRGNTFRIQQQPALLLRGSAATAIVCDFGLVPFANFVGFAEEPIDTSWGLCADGIVPGVSLRDAIAALHSSNNWTGGHQGEDDILCGLVEQHFAFSEANDELDHISSYAVGSQYLLSWVRHRSPSADIFLGTEAAVAQWQQQVNRALESAPKTDSRTEAFHYFLNNVLRAEPTSRWAERMHALRIQARERLSTTSNDVVSAQRQVQALTDALNEAERKVQSAKDAYFPPAETSAGIRAQREGLNDAQSEHARLETELAEARHRLDVELRERQEAISARDLWAGWEM